MASCNYNKMLTLLLELQHDGLGRGRHFSTYLFIFKKENVRNSIYRPFVRKTPQIFFTANTSSSSAPKLEGEEESIAASLREVYCQGDFFLAFGQRRGISFPFFSESRVAECLTTVATFPFPLSCRPTYSKGGLYRLSVTMRSFHFIARRRDTMRALFLSYFIVRTEAIHWKSLKNILESKISFSLPNMTCFRA